MKTPLFLSVLALGAILPHGYAQAPVESPPQVEMKPIKAALFKNGFGYLSFEGKMPKSERLEMTNLPIPSLGTFWMNASSPTKILKLTSSPVKMKLKVDSGNFYEIAKANIGREICVAREGVDKTNYIRGYIIEVSMIAEPDNPNLIGSTDVQNGNSGREMIVLKGESNPKDEYEFTYIPVNEIKDITFFKGPPNKAEREVEKTVLQVNLENPAEGILSASCLAKGISWTPEYKINLGDSGKASFQAQALVMNDLMDMDKVDMSFVSGFPSLKFANVESPLAGRYKSLDDFLLSRDEGKGEGTSNRLRRVLTNSFSLAGNGLVTGGIRSDSSSHSSPNDVVQAEDLFFYPVKGFSSKYGETALVPLFGGEVAYKHLYVWDIPEQKQLLDWDRQFDSGFPAPQDTSRDIWHSIRFTNSFSLPLTKGALEFTSKGNLAGQGVVEFTSPGQEATVRVNKTMQVSVSREEKTISTEQKSVQVTATSTRNYTSSTIEGTLTMKNYSDKPMMMEITKRIQGTPVSASDKGSFSSVPGWNPMNPNGKFKWMLELPAGKTMTLTYQYTYMDN